MKPLECQIIAICGPGLDLNLAQATVMPQTEEDEKNFVTKYIIGCDPAHDARGTDISNSEGSPKSSE